MIEMPDERQDVFDEAIDELVERPSLGRRRLGDAGFHLGSAGHPHDRLGGQPRNAIDEHVDDAIAHRPHRLGLKGERIIWRGIVRRRFHERDGVVSPSNGSVHGSPSTAGV